MRRTLCGSHSGLKAQNCLWQTEDHWPQKALYEDEIDASSPDVGKVTSNAIVVEGRQGMLSRFERFFSWQRLKIAIALCLKYKRRLKLTINIAVKNPTESEILQVNG